MDSDFLHNEVYYNECEDGEKGEKGPEGGKMCWVGMHCIVLYCIVLYCIVSTTYWINRRRHDWNLTGTILILSYELSGLAWCSSSLETIMLRLNALIISCSTSYLAPQAKTIG